MEFLFQQGLELCRTGEYQQAITLFDQVLVDKPDHQPSLYNKAKAKAKLSFLDEALRDYNTLISLSPSNADYFSDRAILQFHLKENDLAIADMDMACDLEPSKGYRYASRAFLKDRIGDLNGALKDYDEAIRLDPDDAISHNNEGLIEEKLGYLERSQNSFKNADDISGVKESSYPVVPTEENRLDKSNDTAGKSIVQERITFKNYFLIIRNLFTMKASREDFLNFIFDFFSSKKR